MPTPSEAVFPLNWSARPPDTRRSVFSNYQPEKPGRHGWTATSGRGERAEPEAGATVDAAVARSFLYRFLAKAFEDPTPAGWRELTAPAFLEALEKAAAALEDKKLMECALGALDRLRSESFEEFHDVYWAAFGHAARGVVPLNEIEYGEPKADPLIQPHRLADLAAYYRAFGLEIAEEAAERPDHLCIELEFMSVLAAKEAYALGRSSGDDLGSVCREAQRGFLREHLGRWSLSFAGRLGSIAPGSLLAFLGQLLKVFVESDCARHQVPSGHPDLALRPVDEAAERLCEGCGLGRVVPGA